MAINWTEAEIEEVVASVVRSLSGECATGECAYTPKNYGKRAFIGVFDDMNDAISAAEQGYEPAKEAIRAINNNLNAQIVIGVCDLFYYASNIIDDRAEDMYAKEHQVNYHGIDKKQRREIRAKKQAQGHTMSW